MAHSPLSSTETVPISDPNNLLNVNMNNVTKLTASNFLMWSRQVHVLLDGYDLAGYIDGSTVAPPLTIDVEGVLSPNPAFTRWKRQDKLLYSSLLGAITVTVHPILSTTTTSAQIWETLSATYAKPSRAHIQQLRQQVKTWTKGTMSIDAYVQGFITRFDQLALLGKPYELEDQVEHFLEGLPEEYKQIVDQIESREVTPSITEVHEMLLNFEVKLQTKTPAPTVPPITANAAQFRGNSSNNNRNSYQGQSRNHNKGQQTWQQQQQFSPRPY